MLGIEGSGRPGVTREKLNELLANSDAIVGSSRQISMFESQAKRELPVKLNWTVGIEKLVAEVEQRQGNIIVLASGDPGYFGIVRLLRSRFPGLEMEIHPVPSAVSLAFAKAGTNWEDAAVISAHGRSYQSVLVEILKALEPGREISKMAVLCSPEHTPQFVAQILRDANASFDRYIVCAHLGSDSEFVTESSLSLICEGTFDHHSILLALNDLTNEKASISNLITADSNQDFLHRKGMITKPEVREVILSKLIPNIPGEAGCLWDLGAGSGSIGISAIQRIPSLRVFLIDKDPIQIRLIQLNSSNCPNVSVIAGRIQDVVWELPDPNAVFIGGGGTEVLEILKTRLKKRTFTIASFAAVNRAAEAADQLGNLMQIMIPVGKRLPDGSWRLEGENPVFISWGWLG
ncbi:MAG: precorrin-6y C5,15-methyltransferase (decarboxylating) subunit CbiE [Acidimicrobiaceae bacterium]|nr:precorrin-6y C5,15-methyltransferase (decarboxylating) subunit CbiE [Acidimicrobiaceae bacterium]